MANGGPGSMYGPVLIGLTLNCILYGATAVQTFIYFQTFKSDKWRMKLFAFYLLFFETLNTVFDIGMIYESLIIHNGTPEASMVAPKLLMTHPLTTVMISFPAQLFIAWRVKVMSRSYVLPVAISLLSIASFAGGIGTGVSLFFINFQYSRFRQNDRYVIIWLVSSAAADVVITASLVHSLLRKRTGFAATDDVINRIIRLTLQTGSLTAVSATLDVTLYFLLRGKMWNFILNLALSKLYSNTILSSLNARGGWKASSTVRDNVLFGNGTDGNMARSRTQIEIVTTTTTDAHPRRRSGTIPMKVLDSGLGHSHDESDSSSAINVVPASVQAMHAGYAPKIGISGVTNHS